MRNVDVIFIVLIVVYVQHCTEFSMTSASDMTDPTHICVANNWIADEIEEDFDAVFAKKIYVRNWRVFPKETFFRRQTDLMSCGVSCIYYAEHMERHA